jgi:predicted DNA-binding transcriptional regulator YafY
MRTFAVHRFRRATLTDRSFEPPADFTPEGYLRGAFRIWRGANAVRVRLAVDREAAGWVSERRWHSSQQIRRRPGGACELTLTVDGVQEVTRFILQLGAAVEVLEPAWLRAEVAREHTAAARRGRGTRRVAQRLEILTPDDTRTRHSG